MDEEIIQTEATEPQPEAQPEPSVDIEAAKAELAKKERDLQKGFDEIARRERELQDRTAPKPVVEDDDLGLDPEAEKVLDKFVSRKTSQQEQFVRQMWQDMAQSEVEKVADKAGISVEELERTITENGLNPAGPTRRDVAEMANKAVALHKATTFNLDSEREKMRAEILAELANEGVEVVSVKQGKVEANAPLEGDVYEMSPADRVRYYEEKGWV